MPEEGISYVPRKHLMTYEELLATTRLLAGMGIEKVRITGGEPFVRKDLICLLEELTGVAGINQVAITTNGVLLKPYLSRLEAMGIRDINLSLDALDRNRFHQITRRDYFEKVWDVLQSLLAMNFRVKINGVVIDGQNSDDILPMVELTRDAPVSVRFIEEMPFNGEGSHYPVLRWNHQRILDHIKQSFDDINMISNPSDATAQLYQIPGFTGTIGIIAAFSRTFCGTCNRIRLSANGDLRTCLYGQPKLNVRDLLRQGTDEATLKHVFSEAFKHRARDGFEAEQEEIRTSMSVIGG
jgi:cyclic pyranopterin phosphate synthase